MPGETMTDEGYGVLGVSWTLTHDLTHVGYTYMADKGEVAEVCCSWEKVSVSKLLVLYRLSRCLPMFMRHVGRLLSYYCITGEKNKERNVDFPRQLPVVSGESMHVPC